MRISVQRYWMARAGGNYHLLPYLHICWETDGNYRVLNIEAGFWDRWCAFSIVFKKGGAA